MLTAIPDGRVRYLDATIFYYHLVDTPVLSDDCSDLLKRIELGSVHGVTSTVTIAEATHKVMLADVVQRHGVEHRGLIARLKRHPELLDGLTNHQRVVTTLRGLRLPVEGHHPRPLGPRCRPVRPKTATDQRRAHPGRDGETGRDCPRDQR